MSKLNHIACFAVAIALGLSTTAATAAETVTVDNFVRAETDMTMKRYADQGGFGKLLHIRRPTPLDKQDVIRMNLDTLYSLGVFDLTEPVTIIKPDVGDRFQSMLVINQDHSMLPVEHGAGEFTYDQETIGSRYVIILFRTFGALIEGRLNVTSVCCAPAPRIMSMIADFFDGFP